MQQTNLPGHDPRGDAATTAAVVAAYNRTRGAKPTTPELGHRTPQPTFDRNRKRRLTALDLEDIQAILDRAEDGDVERLADLWLRMLKSDDHLRSVWDTRMGPVAAARWELAPPDVDETMAEAANRAVRGCEQALRGIDGLESTFLSLLDAAGLGYSVAETKWKRGTLLGRPAWVPYAIEPVHGRRFAFADDYELGLYDNSMAVPDLRDAGWEVEVIKGRGRQMARLPESKYIIHQPREINDYATSTGLVFAAARWWWAKQMATMFGLATAETHANPKLHGHVEQTAPDTVIEELHEGLELLAADGVVVTRGETDISVIDTKGQGAVETWHEVAKRMDAALSKLVLGSTLNVEIGESGGNRAAAESQADQTITPRQQRDAAQMWQSIRRDLLTWVVRFNPEIFGPNAPIPVGRSIMAEDPVEVDDLAVSSGYVRVDELRESRGLAPIGGEVGDSFIKPQPTAPRAFSDAPVEVATPDPFAASRRPWDEAESLARALTSRGASATSGHSPTRSETPPSAPSAAPPS